MCHIISFDLKARDSCVTFPQHLDENSASDRGTPLLRTRHANAAQDPQNPSFVLKHLPDEATDPKECKFVLFFGG